VETHSDFLIVVKGHSWRTPLDTRQLAGGRKAARRKARQERLPEQGLFLYNCGMMEVLEDHVHVFVEAPPRYSPAICISYGKRCMIEETNIMIGPKMGAAPIPATLP